MISDIKEIRSASGTSFRVATNRPMNEFYATPPEATRAFLAAEQFNGTIWEPACGQGHIDKELIANGYETIATDLIDHGYGDGQEDFLKSNAPRAKHIITNPPYGRGLADAFIRKSLCHITVTGGKSAMLINLSSLCHPSRHSSFIKRPPVRIYALDECICFPNGIAKRASAHALQRYCWAVWESEPNTETSFHWLTTAPYR